MVLQSELMLKEKVRDLLDSNHIYFGEEYKPQSLAKFRYDFFFVINEVKIALETKGDLSRNSMRQGKSIVSNIRQKINKGYLNFCDYLIIVRPDKTGRSGKKYEAWLRNDKLRWSTLRSLMMTIENVSNP